MEINKITNIAHSKNLRDQLCSLETWGINCAHKINLRDQQYSFTKKLRVYLCGGEIGWMENFGEKMGRKLFWVYLVGWGGRKINSRVQMFSSRVYQKVFSQKWREKYKEKLSIIFGWKCPCAIAQGRHHFLGRCQPLLFSFLSFFFRFTGQACPVFFFFFFHLLSFVIFFFFF